MVGSLSRGALLLGRLVGTPRAGIALTPVRLVALILLGIRTSNNLVSLTTFLVTQLIRSTHTVPLLLGRGAVSSVRWARTRTGVAVVVGIHVCLVYLFLLIQWLGGTVLYKTKSISIF